MPEPRSGAEHGPAAPVPRRVGHLHHALPRRAQLLAALFLAGAAALVPWTLFVGATLPPRYPAGHWDVLWTGFDVGLMCVLGYAAWAAWFRRQIVASTIIVAGTLLLCDAWFDTVTSIGHRDQWLTLLTGLGVELPLALFCFWLYRRIALNTLATLCRALGEGPPPRRLREARIPLAHTLPPLQPAVTEVPGPGAEEGQGRGRGEQTNRCGTLTQLSSRQCADVVLCGRPRGSAEL